MMYLPNYSILQTANVSRTLVGNGIGDYSNVVAASHVGAAQALL